MKMGIKFRRYIIGIFILILLTFTYFIIVKNGFFIKEKIVSSIIETEYSHLKEGEKVKKETINDIDIYYNSLDESDLEDIRYTIDENYDNLKGCIDSVFGKNQDRLDIVLINNMNEFNKDFNYESEITERQGVYANKTIYMPVDYGIDEYVMWHEYTHYRFDEFCIKNEINSFNIPSWFNEGVSEYIAYKEFQPLSMEEDYKSISLEDIENVINGDDERVEIAYYKSYKLVEKLVELKGENIIGKIILDSKGQNFYIALEKNIGMKVEKLEELLD